MYIHFLSHDLNGVFQEWSNWGILRMVWLGYSKNDLTGVFYAWSDWGILRMIWLPSQKLWVVSPVILGGNIWDERFKFAHNHQYYRRSIFGICTISIPMFDLRLTGDLPTINRPSPVGDFWAFIAQCKVCVGVCVCVYTERIACIFCMHAFYFSCAYTDGISLRIIIKYFIIT